MSNSPRVGHLVVVLLLGTLAAPAAAEELAPLPSVPAAPPAISVVPATQPPTPQTAPATSELPPATPPPVGRDHNPPAFRADLKLPFSVASFATEQGTTQSPFAPVPQLVLGFHYGRLGLGAGIGFTSVAVSVTEIGTGLGGITSAPSNTTTVTELLFAPTLTLDIFQSNDGKVALYLLGAPIFGDIILTNQASETDLGFQFALGANVALHENFRIGLEVGPVGHFYSGSETESESTVAMYTALVGSFLYPR